MNVVLDAWAVLRLLEGTEPAASRVHRMAYADAFAAATAMAHDAALLTGDPELLGGNPPWQFEDLRG